MIKRKRFMVYVVVNGKPVMFQQTRYFHTWKKAEAYRNKLAQKLKPYNEGKDAMELMKEDTYYFEVWIKDLEVLYGKRVSEEK